MKTTTTTLLLTALLGCSYAVKRDDNYVASNNPVYPGASGANPTGDHQAAASSNSYQSLGPGNGGATYYYYYPQHENKKDQSNNYQASSSNNYASAVTPNQDGHEPVGASTDLSYSHEMGAMGSNMHDGPNYGAQYNAQAGNSPPNGGYDLSALAAQYANSQAQNGPHFNPAAFSGPAAYPTANSFDPSQGANFAPNQNDNSAAFQAAAAAAGYQGAAAAGGAYPGASAGGPFPAYGGQHFGNYAAGSSQSNSYEPSSSSSGLRKYGLGSIIMPMLALAGLSLLIPTVTSLSGLSSSSSSSRRKRSADGKYESGIGGMVDRAERYYDIYKTAVVKEDCINRILCQLGDAVKDVRGKQTFFSLLEKLPASWMGNKIGVFKKGAMGMDYKKCQQYAC